MPRPKRVLSPEEKAARAAYSREYRKRHSEDPEWRKREALRKKVYIKLHRSMIHVSLVRSVKFF